MSMQSEEQLAFEAVEAGDYERAKQLLLPLVRQGSTYARDLIDWMWEPEERVVSDAVEAGDYERARELLIPLARHGSIHAMQLLGWMHENGKMPNSSKMDAISCYRKAAESGSTRSFYSAGMMLLESGDKKEARSVFEQGVALGSMQCMFGLGLCLAQGQTDYNRQESVRWFERAAEQGHFVAKRKLLGMSTRRSFFDRVMFLPRLLKLMVVGAVLHWKDRNSERLY